MDNLTTTVILALAGALGTLLVSMRSWIKNQGAENEKLRARDDAQQKELNEIRIAAATSQAKAEVAEVLTVAAKSRADEFEKAHANLESKLKSIALTCPVTHEKCPLQELFK